MAIPFKKFLEKLNQKASFPKWKDVLVRQGKLFPDDEAASPNVLRTHAPRHKPVEYLDIDTHQIRTYPRYRDYGDMRTVKIKLSDGHDIGHCVYTEMKWSNKEQAGKFIDSYTQSAVLHDALSHEIRKMKSDSMIHLYHIGNFHLDDAYRKQNVATLAFAKVMKAMRMRKPCIVFFEVSPADNRKPFRYKGKTMDAVDTLSKYYETLGFKIVKDAYGDASGYQVFK